jgi:hypothetical protein
LFYSSERGVESGFNKAKNSYDSDDDVGGLEF